MLLAVSLGLSLVSGLPAEADDAVPAILKTARLTISTSSTSQPILRGWREFDAADIAEYYPGAATGDEVNLDVRGGTGSLPTQHVSVTFAVPLGQRFRAGQQTNGEGAYPDDLVGSVSFGSMACGGIRFMVLDAVVTGDQVSRLDIRFAGTCGQPAPFFTGELVLGKATTPVLVAGRAPGWFETPIGTTARTQIPLWYRNMSNAARSVGRAALTYGCALGLQDQLRRLQRPSIVRTSWLPHHDRLQSDDIGDEDGPDESEDRHHEHPNALDRHRDAGPDRAVHGELDGRLGRRWAPLPGRRRPVSDHRPERSQ